MAAFVIAFVLLGLIFALALAKAASKGSADAPASVEGGARSDPSSGDGTPARIVEGGSPTAHAGNADPGNRRPPSTITDLFCEECFAPAKMTPRGPRCERHDFPEIMCEPCGERPAAAVHNGLWMCGRCISEGWL